MRKLQHVHGYDVLECGSEDREDLADGSGRADKREVILLDRLRAALAPVAADTEVYALLRDGVPVDFADPASPHNRFLPVSKLWIRGEKGFRRPDMLLYVNGLPLVFIELKDSNVKLT